MSTIYVDSEVLARIEYRFFDAFPFSYETRTLCKKKLMRALDIAKRARAEYKAKGGTEGMYQIMSSHIDTLERNIGV